MARAIAYFELLLGIGLAGYGLVFMGNEVANVLFCEVFRFLVFLASLGTWTFSCDASKASEGILFVLGGIALIVIALYCLYALKNRANGKIDDVFDKPYGLYNSMGRLLTVEEATKAIEGFDREACNNLLLRFGHPAISARENVEQLRNRCIEALKHVS